MLDYPAGPGVSVHGTMVVDADNQGVLAKNPVFHGRLMSNLVRSEVGSGLDLAYHRTSSF